MTQFTSISSRGFTLTELLVGVAILSALVALSLPFIQDATDSARRNHCLSGLRQLQVANHAYASDNQGKFVPVFSNNDKGKRTSWHNNRRFVTMLGCSPDAPARVPLEIRCTVAEVTGAVGWGYNFTGLSGGISTPGHVRGVRVSQVVRPSETIAFIDSLDWQVQRSSAGKYVGNEKKITHATAYRHGKQQLANAVFWDGHAASFTMEELDNNRHLWDMLKANP